jgi:iron complex transport system permease protein
MVVASTALYLWLLGGRRTDIHLLLLVGVVFGVFFRSISSFFQRLLDPAAYLRVQDAMFASFRGVQPDVLVACGLIVAACLGVVAVLGRRLDVMLLGRDPAVALGVDHRRVTIVVLVVVSFLVSASTALIGPVMFFGLIVANAAYALLGTALHRFTLPVASLLGVIALAGGEMVLGAPRRRVRPERGHRVRRWPAVPLPAPHQPSTLTKEGRHVPTAVPPPVRPDRCARVDGAGLARVRHRGGVGVRVVR